MEDVRRLWDELGVRYDRLMCFQLLDHQQGRETKKGLFIAYNVPNSI